MPKNDKKKKIPSPPMPPLIENARMNEVYEVKGLLGKGGFAKVYAVKSHTSKKIMACKAVLRASLVKVAQIQKLKYEIKIHRELKHPNIVRYFINFQDKERIYILMEYCKNQTLMELVGRRKRLSEPETQYYMLEILGGVRYLHDTNVIHRDLKLGNILIDANMHCKIADFGLATKLQTPEQRKTTICGTPNYIAPEVLDGKKGGHSFEADIWSMGVIMYTLLLGIPPFQTGRVNSTYKKIKASSYEYPSHIKITSYARCLIDNMLQKYAKSRPTLLGIIQDEFFSYIKPPTSLPVSALRTCPPEYASIKTDIALRAEKKRARGISDKNASQKAQNERLFKRTRYNPLVNQKKVATKGLKSGRVGGEQSSNKCGIIIEKWIDYRKKYGVGYCLNNGSVGVWFNDNTRILLHPDKETISYMGSTTRK
jgi:polo-like kinase 1